MALLATTLIYLAALAGIVVCSLGVIFFAGGALNQGRPRAFRLRRATYTLLCLCGIVASAAGGFVGIASVMYYAQQ